MKEYGSQMREREGGRKVRGRREKKESKEKRMCNMFFRLVVNGLIQEN